MRRAASKTHGGLLESWIVSVFVRGNRGQAGRDFKGEPVELGGQALIGEIVAPVWRLEANRKTGRDPCRWILI